MSWLDPNWKYISAAESAKPGYLQRRFDEIRQRLLEKAEQDRKDAEEQAAKVRKIGRRNESPTPS
jgi:hypothetical protein